MTATGSEIAVVGIAGRFPGAKNVSEFWDNLKAGRESIAPPDDETANRLGTPTNGDPDPHTQAHWVKVNSLLPDVDLFDASFFGFNPREAEMTDPQHRLFLECALEALEDAGYRAGDRPRQVGVFAGASASGYVFGQLTEGAAHLLDTLPAMIGNDKDYLASRTSYKLNLSGPSVTVQCACSTSLVAVHLACQSLIAGECDAAIAGGISISVPRIDRYFYLPGGLLSPDGRCRAFDARARGTAFAEGMGAVTLMRLEDALAENFQIYAVLLGTAVNNDASLKAAYTAPSIEGQFQVVRQAHAVAGIEPSDISYIEAHGTGTVLGDAVELAALTRWFRSSASKVGTCALGSVKTNIGHLSTAAGIAGLLKTVLALKHQVLPPSLNFHEPNPDLDLATSPFYVNTRLLEWPARPDRPRRAGVSSFGVGGTNAHLVLEEAPETPSGPGARDWHLLPLSAKTPTAVATATENLKTYLMREPHIPFSDVVYTAQLGRCAFEHRRVVVCSGREEAVRLLSDSESDQVMSKRAPGGPPTVAFMFPGQGAQMVSMGAQLYAKEKHFRESMNQGFDILRDELRTDLRSLLYPGANVDSDADQRLAATALAQPALFLTEYALAKLLDHLGIRPQMMIGHSVGELVAACLAGVFSLEDALKLVVLRGRMMQEMPPGVMLSVLLSADEVQPLLSPQISLAAVNGPKHCVLSGDTEAIAALEGQLAGRSIACRRLRTSHAFHSHLMEPMLEAFAQGAARFIARAPELPYVSNLTGELVTSADVADPAYWSRQIRQPVLFAKGLQTLTQRGAKLLIEVGPGRVLATLARQCGLKPMGVEVISTMSHERGGADAMALTRAIGRMWLSGVVVDWAKFYEGESRRRVSLPTYPFERRRFWKEVQLGDPPHSADRKRPKVSDWFYTLSWRRLGPLAPAAVTPEVSSGSSVVVFCDDHGIGEQMAARLETATGLQAVVVRAGEGYLLRDDGGYVIDPAREEDYVRLFADLAASSRRPARVLHLLSLAPPLSTRETAHTFRSAQERGLYSLLRTLKGLRAADSAHGPSDMVGIDVVSNGLFDVIGTETLRPSRAPIIAFAKVASQEHPWISCRIHDLELPADDSQRAALAAAVTEDIARSSRERVVAWRHGLRWGQRVDGLEMRAPAGLPARLKPNGVYLITGGLGKIGLSLAEYLARECHARLVLVGRSPLPPREDWEATLANETCDKVVKEKLKALRRIEEAGGEVLLAQANVANEEELAAVKRQAEQRFGAISGVIFGAGKTELGRSAFQETGIEECESHFEGKVYGVLALERVFQETPLDFCMLLSSLSTVLGGLGHMAYSAANQFADALVLHGNRSRPRPWTTVNWDSWRFIESDDDASGITATLTRLSMLPAEGVEAFRMLLDGPSLGQVVVSTADLELRLQQWVVHRGSQPKLPAGDEGRVYARPELDTPYAEPEGDLERRLAEIWRQALGTDRVGRNDDFFELGGHSLMAIQMLARMQEVYGIDFPIDRAFEATTIRKAAVVVDEILTKKVEAMSEEEAMRLLAQQSTTSTESA